MAATYTIFTAFFLVSTLLTFSSLPSSLASASASHLHRKTTTKEETEFIRSKCNSTEYPRLCVASLWSYAPTIHNNPIHLADAALSVCLNSMQSTSAMMVRLATTSSTGRHMSSRETKVVSDCVESMRDSVEYLRESLKEMGNLSHSMDTKVPKGKDVMERIDDVQTWVRTALTDEETCVNVFGTDEEGVKGAVRGQVVRVAQLTSNALVLVSQLVSTE